MDGRMIGEEWWNNVVNAILFDIRERWLCFKMGTLKNKTRNTSKCSHRRSHNWL